jgi:hypothetical protein
VHQIAAITFAVALAVAALSMIGASARLRSLRPTEPVDESALSFGEMFARRSLYGLVLSGHHRRIGDRRLTLLVLVSRTAIVVAALAGLYWKLGS